MTDEPSIAEFDRSGQGRRGYESASRINRERQDPKPIQGDPSLCSRSRIADDDLVAINPTDH